ncbi:MAG: hypothetical protein ACKO3V_10245 [Pirellula sp.]
MRSKAFFKKRFAVRPRRDSGADHWIGGENVYEGAECPVCHVGLVVILDVNCEDPVLQKASGGKLAKLKRLLLLFCPRCLGELSYRVDEQSRVHVIQARNSHPGNELYPNYPVYFPRKPFSLDDSAVTAAVSEAAEEFFDVGFARLLSESARRVLEDFAGHPNFIPRFLYHHQLGGESLHDAWDENAAVCPNEQCPRRVFEKVLRRGRPMRFLAGVINDPPGGLPLIEPLNAKTELSWNFFASFYYQICDRCLTITTFNTSD